MASIPAARERLRALSAEHGLPELAEIADTLHRCPPVRKAPRTSRPMSDALAAAIREDAARNPAMPYAELAARHGVNQGRVSEALRGEA